MTLNPWTQPGRLGASGGEGGEDRVRQRDGLAGGEQVVEPAVEVGRRGLAHDGDVRDTVGEDAIGGQVARRGVEGVLEPLIGAGRTALVGEAGGAVIGDGFLLLLPVGWLPGMMASMFGRWHGADDSAATINRILKPLVV